MGLDPALPLLLSRPHEGLAGLALVLTTAGALTWILYARGNVFPSRGVMPFTSHLEELTDRIRRLAILYVFWATTFLLLRFEPVRLGPLALPAPVFDVFDNAAARIYNLVALHTVPDGVRLMVSRPTEAFAAQAGVALFLAFILVLPSLLFEVWAFFAPGLRPNERRLVGATLPAALVLFIAGAAFAYVYLVPLMLEVFYQFAEPIGATSFIATGSLVSSVVTFGLLIGLAFELPLVMVVLVRLQVATHRTYLHYWRHSTLAIFIVAAIVTDPTLMSQLIVASLLLALYWGGVMMSYWARPASAVTRRKGAATAQP